MTCLTDKFPFVLQDNLDIQKQSFNSNFICKYQKTLPSDKNKENNIVDFNDKHLDNLVIQPNFI